MPDREIAPEHRLARALISFALEHGIPNAVSPGELATYHTDLRAPDIGRLLRWRRQEIDQRLNERGFAIKHYARNGRLGMRLELEKL